LGAKGLVQSSTHSAEPEALFSSKRWYLQPTLKGKANFSGTQLIRIRETKFHADQLVAVAHDINDRDDALSLKGSRIFIPRSSFPTPELDSYYWVDLIGLAVFNRESIHLGVVKDLLATGPQTVLVIEYDVQDHEGRKTVHERMIPFVSHYIDKVDLENKRIVVDWQLDY